MRGEASNDGFSITIGQVYGLLAKLVQLLYVGEAHKDGPHVQTVLNAMVSGYEVVKEKRTEGARLALPYCSQTSI